MTLNEYENNIKAMINAYDKILKAIEIQADNKNYNIDTDYDNICAANILTSFEYKEYISFEEEQVKKQELKAHILTLIAKLF